MTPAQNAATAWRMVPVEPTPEMVEAGKAYHPMAATIYRAMLAASPTPADVSFTKGDVDLVLSGCTITACNAQVTLIGSDVLTDLRIKLERFECAVTSVAVVDRPLTTSDVVDNGSGVRYTQTATSEGQEAWRDGWAECKGRLTEDEAFCLTEDVEEDAWLDSATAALARAGGDGWRGIESAPENQAVQVFIPNADYYGNQGVYAAMLVNMGTGPRWMTFGWAVGRDCAADSQPTHWRPLPAAPDAGEE